MRRLVIWVPALIWTALVLGFSSGDFSAENTGSLLAPLLMWLFPWLTPEPDRRDPRLRAQGRPPDRVRHPRLAVVSRAHRTPWLARAHGSLASVGDQRRLRNRGRDSSVHGAQSYQQRRRRPARLHRRDDRARAGLPGMALGGGRHDRRAAVDRGDRRSAGADAGPRGGSPRRRALAHRAGRPGPCWPIDGGEATRRAEGPLPRSRVHPRAPSHAAQLETILVQRDTYFAVPRGRLKLREVSEPRRPADPVRPPGHRRREGQPDPSRRGAGRRRAGACCSRPPSGSAPES